MKQKLSVPKPNLRGFFREYGKIMLALLGIVLITYAVMSLFTQAAFKSTEHRFEVIPSRDESGTQYWDLSESSFDGKRYSMISSMYYPGVLLTPENIDDYNPEPIPENAPVADYITQRFIVKVPFTDQAYKIWFAGLHWSARAYANGVLINEEGNPATSSEDMRISRIPLVIYAAPDENGIIDIVYQTASFRHYEDLAYTTEAHISPASHDYDLSVRKAGRPFDIVLVGMYLGFGLLTLGLFFTRPKKSEHLWFALCCFIMAMRAGLEGGQFTRALPFLSEDFIYYMFYIGEPLMIFLLMLYFNRVFPKIIPKAMLWVLGGATAVVLGVIAFSEPAFFTLFENRYMDFVPLVFIAFLIPLIVRFRKPVPEQLISLFGIVLFMVGVVLDILREGEILGYSSPYTAVEVFTLVFAVTQLIALFMGNYRATDSAREAERRIAAEKEAVERINRLKTEFLANISHELKTPLTVMSGHAQHGQSTLRNIPEAEEAERGMKLIASEADRLALMVSQVLDVSQIDEGRMQLNLKEASITQLIQSMLDTYYPVFSKNHNTLSIIPATLPHVRCDEARVMQVLVNLVSNAARHTRGGEITIRAEQAEGFIRVNVTDTGEGISPEEMATLFERYRTKKAPGDTGTGLGLYISKYIVEAHGGTLIIESVPGKGTTASFTLPLA
ncbi:sensor histidine kinase [Oscillospiraceae bacterium OttesenSCG-928-G22]|nr:sensor histidine kinase [Oscillospiraceae bacterium OttesenSCG-928-G22]